MRHRWWEERVAESGWRGEGTRAVEIGWIDDPLVVLLVSLGGHLLILLVVLEVSVCIY